MSIQGRPQQRCRAAILGVIGGIVSRLQSGQHNVGSATRRFSAMDCAPSTSRLNVKRKAYPLSKHRFARPAAQALECAAEQGRFEEFLDIVFTKQDSLGLKSWTSFAADARVANMTQYQKCSKAGAQMPRIEQGFSLARKLGVSGTPTLFVNGWSFPKPPTKVELVAAISAILAGRKPFAKAE